MIRRALRLLRLSLGRTMGRLIPEGEFKEWIRASLWRRYDPLYVLAKRINRTELLAHDVLLVELDDGTKLYSFPDRQVSQFLSRRIRLMSPRQARKIDVFVRFISTFEVLTEQFVDKIYEQYYEPRRGDTIVDVGANIGVFSARIAKAVGPEGSVVAIEPEPRNLLFLHRNLEANNITNVIVVGKGAWKAKGRVRLYVSQTIVQHSVYPGAHYRTSEDEFVEVDTDTLDNILRELNIKQVDFVKMDIEGSEIEALEGMQETLKGHVNLAIAAYHEVNGRPTEGIVAQYLRSKGFSVRVKDGYVYASPNAG